MARASQLTAGLDRDGIPRRRVWEIEVDEFGLAPTKVWTGDIDGSGESPGVQLEFEHVGCPGGAAVAFSGREAELVSKALSQAASHIQPHERLRVRHRKFQRSIEVEQPKAGPPPVETIALGSTREAEVLHRVLSALPEGPDKLTLKDVIAQLEIPF